MFRKAISHIGIFFLTLLSLLPFWILYGLADILYYLFFYIVGYRRQVVQENLRNSFPEKSAAELAKIEKRFYRFLSSLMLEIVKMSTISAEELKRRCRFKNTEMMEQYFAKGESVLTCSSHYGNWEWVNVAIDLTFSAQNYAIYKPLSSTVFDKWFYDARSRFGNKMVSMRQTLRAFSSAPSPNIFTFGNDQAPSRDESQYWTSFLNQPSSIQLGIEKLAKKSNRPIFYLKIGVKKRGYYEIDCVPLCLEPGKTAPYEITELHTRFLENFIKEEPAYWLWSHRRWKYKPKTELV